MRAACRSLALVTIVLPAWAVAAAPASTAKTGPIPSFTLKDYRGQTFDLAKQPSDKIVVLAFLGTECPLAKLYAPRLVELAKEYESRGVLFVGVDSNRQDSATEIAAYARQHAIEFPILKDLNQAVADQVGATRTPEVVVLDKTRVIRYQGRIDDQYGLVNNAGYQRKEPAERNLAAALDELLAGKTVSRSQVAASGCLIGRDRKPAAGSDVTYSKQIARILNDNCVYCHRAGQIAPFTLTNYEDVVGWAAMIDEVVQGGRMPPWHADSHYGHFKNDARLSDADKKTIARWVAAGAPQGNPKDLPEPPQFAEGWMIPEPDQVIYMADKPFDVPATGVVDYQMFTVDPGWTEEKWISAIEPRPGNAAVVHHILIFVLEPGGGNLGLGSGNDFVGAFAPGLRPELLPTGMARRVPAGSKLIFQMHYTPNGAAQQDRSYLGIKFADPQTVKQEVQVTSAINFAFQIPPGADDFPAASRYVFTRDTVLLTMMPHMHLRGKAFRYEATYPDGKKEILLDVPQYDFGWQTNYRLEEPKLMPMGTRLDCFATFDNSEENLNNPDPKATVGFGDQTFEEMMIGFFEIVDPHQDLTRLKSEANAQAKMSRVEKFLVILKATNGEPDANLGAGIYLALSAPEWFGRFAMTVPIMVPQVDRSCVTQVVDGKLTQTFGPFEGRRGAGKEPQPDRLVSKLPDVDAKDEPLAAYAAGDKVIVNNDLTKVEGKTFAKMVKRGAKSSMHVPIDLNGKRATVNFWSTDANAFPQPAEQFLTGVAKGMAAAQAQPRKSLPESATGR